MARIRAHRIWWEQYEEDITDPDKLYLKDLWTFDHEIPEFFELKTKEPKNPNQRSKEP